MSAEDLLTVAEVMERYGLRDRRAARRLIDRVGGFRIGAQLFVRRADLLAFEDAQKAARRPAENQTRALEVGAGRRHAQTIATRPGWWREEGDVGTLAPLNRKR